MDGRIKLRIGTLVITHTLTAEFSTTPTQSNVKVSGIFSKMAPAQIS